MTAWPILLLLLCGVSLGAYLAFGRLKARPRKAWLGGMHLLFGLAALELLLLMLRSLDEDRGIGMVAASLVAAALFLGLVSKLMMSRLRTVGNALWVVHACAGATGFVVLLLFAIKGGS